MKTCVDIDRASEMRQEGMTLQRIGDEFGVSRERIRQLLAGTTLVRACKGCAEDFETTHANQRFCSDTCRGVAYEENQKRQCDCGAPIRRGTARCHDCHREAQKAITDARRQRIAELWATGQTMIEIADAVGTTANALGGELCRMRGLGWDLPLRRAAAPARPATKDQARIQFMAAIRKGQVRRPARCERCGREAHVDGHHSDYSKPLYVEWLCRPCHLAHHSAERKAA